MDRDDVTHLDRLAQRVDFPGPVAVLDPLSRNLLSASQAAGIGDPSKWLYTSGEITLYGGAFNQYVGNSVSVDAIPVAGSTDLSWAHPNWLGYPVTPGLTVTWWAPGLVVSGAALGQLRIEWYDTSKTLLATSTTTVTNAPLVRTAPDKAAYARPVVRFTAKGLWALGQSVFTVGDVAAALSAGDRPSGEGTPAFSITDYSHSATPGNGAYRDISMDLVEVTGEAG